MKRNLIILIFSAQLGGCPGREYFSRQKEELKQECLSYQGNWDAEAGCDPSFEEVVAGHWTSECLPRKDGSYQVNFELSGTSVKYQLNTHSDSSCESSSEPLEFYSESVLSIQATPQGRVMGQRLILTKDSLPQDLRKFETIKIIDQAHVMLLPGEISLTRGNP